jgi:hypothetical protein
VNYGGAVVSGPLGLAEAGAGEKGPRVEHQVVSAPSPLLGDGRRRLSQICQVHQMLAPGDQPLSELLLAQGLGHSSTVVLGQSSVQLE